jgi:hypothetical protein
MGYSGSQSSTADMVIDSEGNVGIGNTTPAFPLTIGAGDGNKILFNESSTIPGHNITCSSGWQWNFNAARSGEDDDAKITFNISGSSGYDEMMRVNHTGVGIGKTDPACTLDVYGTSTTTGISSTRLWLTGIGDNSGDGSPDDNTGSPWYGLGYHDLAWNDQSYKYSGNIPILSGYSGVALRSGAGNLVLTTVGNVGIGTTSPDVKFQVEGTSSSHQKLTKLATWNIFHHRDDGSFEHLITYGGSDGQTYFNNRDNFMYVQIPSLSGETLYTSTVSGYNSGYFNARFRDLNGNKPNLGQNTTYQVHAYSSRIDAFGTITTSGNVGIGTSSPSAILEISGPLAEGVPKLTLRDPNTNLTFRLGLKPGTSGYQDGWTTIDPNGGGGLAIYDVLYVSGTLSVSSTKNFLIDHPLQPTTKKLIHTAVESPRVDLIYRGTTQLKDGRAIVNIDRQCVGDESCAMEDGTFEALCRDPVYYLQNTTDFNRLIGTIDKNLLTIISEDVNSIAIVNWMVVAERKDRDIVEATQTNDNGRLNTEIIDTSERVNRDGSARYSSA